MSYFYDKVNDRVVYFERSDEISLREVTTRGDREILQMMYQLRGDELWSSSDYELFEIHFNLIKFGHFVILKMMIDYGCPWHEHSAKWIAQYGSVDDMIWAISNGCPWPLAKKLEFEPYTYDTKTLGKHTDYLDRIINYNFIDDSYYKACRGPVEHALSRGNIGMLKFLIDPSSYGLYDVNPCPTVDYILEIAMEVKIPEVVQVLIENNCIGKAKTVLEYAVKQDHDVIRYISTLNKDHVLRNPTSVNNAIEMAKKLKIGNKDIIEMLNKMIV
jgi:hypothetical protein